MGVVFSKLRVSGLLFPTPNAWQWSSLCAPFFTPGALPLPPSGDLVEVTPPAIEGRSQEATVFPRLCLCLRRRPLASSRQTEEAQLQGEALESG